MTKEKILQTFEDINLVYNDCTRYDTLKRMLDELQEPCEDCVSKKGVAEVLFRYVHPGDDVGKRFVEFLLSQINDLPPVNPQKPICPSAGVDCDDCPAYEDAISRKAVTDALCSDCELYKNGKRTCFMKCEEYHFFATLPPVVTKEERALLQRWRDNRGVSMEEFAKALELLKEDKA